MLAEPLLLQEIPTEEEVTQNENISTFDVEDLLEEYRNQVRIDVGLRILKGNKHYIFVPQGSSIQRRLMPFLT